GGAAQVLVGGGLGLGVGEEAGVLGHSVVGAGAEVGDHHEPQHGGELGGVHGADRGVPVHRVGAVRVAAAGAGGPDHRIVPADHLGDLGGGQVLHVGDLRTGAGGL